MAATARELHQRRDAVYGNLAYDLDRELRYRELSHAGEARREAAQPKTRQKAAVRTAARQRQRVSFLSVLGFTAVAAMAVLVLMGSVALTELSSDIVELKDQLSALETEQAALTAQYQQIYDLSSVKAAAEAAGMMKPRTSQIFYVDLSGGDSAVVYQEEDSGVLSKALTSLTDGVHSVMEYFE